MLISISQIPCCDSQSMLIPSYSLRLQVLLSLSTATMPFAIVREYDQPVQKDPFPDSDCPYGIDNKPQHPGKLLIIVFTAVFYDSSPESGISRDFSTSDMLNPGPALLLFNP